MDVNEISEIITTAKEYLVRLDSLNSEIKKAEKQIFTTFAETKANIETTFANLKESLLHVLKIRENALLKEAEKIKSDSITPLEQCRSVIETKIENTQNLIKLGDNLNCNNLINFNNAASLLGTLPEVPKLKEVPFITFNFEPDKEKNIRELCLDFGQIFKTAPIQILNIREKPGGLLVEWNGLETEDDSAEIQEYRLQKAFGDVTKEENLVHSFCDCYRGLDMQYLIKDLTVNQPYSFRVCCKLTHTSVCAPWSVPQVASTNLKPFSWESCEDFFFSHENKIAKCLSDNCSILFSNGPQFLIGNSVEFTVLELDNSDCVLGLTAGGNKGSDNLREIKQQSFLLDNNGNIYIDAVEKSTKLPRFSKKLTISFTCEAVNNEKIRVSVDSNDKRVTYDWLLTPDSELFFACQFCSSNLKIMVE